MIDVVNKFNMVDMGGIDIVESQGVAVEGLFSRLLTAIQNCRYQVLYNWKFAKIEIAPSYVELVFDGTRIYINEAVSVTEDDVVHVYSLEPEPAVPVIEPLTVIENGTYSAPAGIDGYSPITVNVAFSLPEPILYSRNASSTVRIEHELASGQYTIVVATTISLLTSDFTLLDNDEVVNMTVVLDKYAGNLRTLSYVNINTQGTDLVLETINARSNSGVQLFIIPGSYIPSLMGSASNDGVTFPLLDGLVLMSSKWGYYGGNNPDPEVTVLYKQGANLSSIPTSGGSIYWYGGTYALKLI